MGRTPAEELDEKTRAHMARYALEDYVPAMRAVLMNEPDLRVRYAGVSGRGEAHTEGEAATPAEEADRRTKAYMREKNERDYGRALQAVLSADPDLKEAYGS